jgi:hypothetical protein
VGGGGGDRAGGGGGGFFRYGRSVNLTNLMQRLRMRLTMAELSILMVWYFKRESFKLIEEYV